MAPGILYLVQPRLLLCGWNPLSVADLASMCQQVRSWGVCQPHQQAASCTAVMWFDQCANALKHPSYRVTSSFSYQEEIQLPILSPKLSELFIRHLFYCRRVAFFLLTVLILHCQKWDRGRGFNSVIQRRLGFNRPHRY